MNKDSCCYNCESRSGDCHTTCKAYKAERKMHDYDIRQRLLNVSSRYSNDRVFRNSQRQVQFDRSGGR